MTREVEMRHREERPPRWLELYRPTATAPALNHVYPEDAIDRGAHVATIDVDGTLRGVFDVHPPAEIEDAVHTMRDRGIERIALVTNTPVRDELSLVKLAWMTDRVGADLAIAAQTQAGRKPGPGGLLLAAHHFGVEPEQIAHFGDRLTTDGAAATLAGAQFYHMSNRIGTDLMGNRIVRDPAEWHIKRKLAEFKPEERERKRAIDIDVMSDSTQNMEVDERLLPLTRKIANVGEGPSLLLTPESEAATATLMADTFLNKRVIQELENATPEAVMRWYDSFVGTHGQMAADILTIARLPIAVAEVIAIKTGHNYIAAGLKVTASIFDKGDGTLAKGYRKRNPGAARTRISYLDDLFDKIESISSEAAMMSEGMLPQFDFYGRTAREGLSTAERRILRSEGVNTDAIWSGKVTTPYATLTDLSVLVQKGAGMQSHIATLAKGASYLHARRIWKLRKAELQEVRRVRDEMLAA